MLEAMVYITVYFIALVAGIQDVKVDTMSFNIRTSLASTDAGSTCSNWDGIRKENVLRNIKTVGADFVGTQETSDAQKVYLDAQLAGMYNVIGQSTGSLNNKAAEWNAMYYRADTWKLVIDGMFWLGPDPNTMSAGWGMTYYRTCVWGRFQHIATGATICVLNTHYETPGNDEAQENGSNIILERIKANCDAKDNLIVLMGDFNALKSYSAMKIMFDHDMKDPSNEGTFCGDMLSPTCSVKYDFTLFRSQRKDACYLKSEISRIAYNGCYTSDHAGLIGSFCLQGSCCLDKVSSSSSGSNGPYRQHDSSVANERTVVGKVQAPNTETRNTPSKTTETKNTPSKTTDPASSSVDVSKTISTSSSGSGKVSTILLSVLGSSGVCGLLAFVIIRRKKKLDEQARLKKSHDPDASGYFGAARSVSDLSTLSLPEGNDARVSISSIPELAAIPCNARISTSSSISASDSDIVRHGGHIPEFSMSNTTNFTSSQRSSIAVMNFTNSEYSSAFGNSILEHESDFNKFVMSDGSNYAESYGNSSEAQSNVNFSEIFVPDSSVSEDSTLVKSQQADFTKL
ncbi:unnamed protein product [Peronospora farinosa]|uniref:Endonuclease/exonuclease/phosphatase domain-containing protein n=1 Tax=Peronospora farinosa TaxID=134698 RepID=A0AAV0TD56_9STRA|nr:unnamed protein product [Peronospora farinosa]CAI5704849.1 unnamed protein product [Peronospora farinosa]CAI5719393.1 unnamed protein product [Peronospora farinosa]